MINLAEEAETSSQEAQSSAQGALASASSAANSASSAASAAGVCEEIASDISGVIANLVGPSEKILTLANGQLSTTLNLGYEGTTGELSIYGKLDDSNKPILLDKISLPLEQFLKDAEVVVDPEDEDPGTYLQLTFETGTGEDQVTYVDVSLIGTSYTSTAASGIFISGTNKISVKVNATSNLETTNSGLGFKTGFSALSSEQATKIANIPLTPAITSIVKGTIDTTSAISSGDELTVGAYLVGANRIELYYEDEYCTQGVNEVFQEVGTAGDLSTTIQINCDVPAGWSLRYVIFAS
jgi:hypothetical protein